MGDTNKLAEYIRSLNDTELDGFMYALFKFDCFGMDCETCAFYTHDVSYHCAYNYASTVRAARRANNGGC